MISGNLIIDDIRQILTVIPFTLGAALIILIFGLLLGLIISIIKIRRIPIAEQLTRIFIDYTRGIPLIIHLYIANIAVPILLENLSAVLGWNISAEPIVVLVAAYSLYVSVGQSENMRGAFTSIEAGQWDAAYACGMSGMQALKRIVIPQGLTVALPAILNNYLGIIKGLSLAFTIGITDILAKARLASIQNYGYLEAYISAALVYWVLCAVLSLLFDKLEKKLKKW